MATGIDIAYHRLIGEIAAWDVLPQRALAEIADVSRRTWRRWRDTPTELDDWQRATVTVMHSTLGALHRAGRPAPSVYTPQYVESATTSELVRVCDRSGLLDQTRYATVVEISDRTWRRLRDIRSDVDAPGARCLTELRLHRLLVLARCCDQYWQHTSA